MKRARLLGWIVVGTVFAVLVVRTFFFGVYYVDSPSMEPTLHGAPEGGDHLLVGYGDASRLRRYDLVVILPPGEKDPFVTRVVGLPGESVTLRGGDLWIDDRISPPDLGVSAPVPIFDEEISELESAFRIGPLWESTADGWRVNASEVDPGANSGLMYMRLGLKDHYYLADGRFVAGRDNVGDGVVECRVRVESPDFVVRVGLSEQGDTFELALRTGVDGTAELKLTRTSVHGRETLGQEQVEFPEGFRALRLANLNDRLLVWVDGALRLEVAYSGNSFLGIDVAKTGISMPSDRVYIGGSAGIATFTGIRVSRDVHYTPRGNYAHDEALELGPGEIFVLGDNSRESQDGRDWGPTDIDEVLGRPIGIVWPPGRVTCLGSPADSALDEVPSAD